MDDDHVVTEGSIERVENDVAWGVLSNGMTFDLPVKWNSTEHEFIVTVNDAIALLERKSEPTRCLLAVYQDYLGLALNCTIEHDGDKVLYEAVSFAILTKSGEKLH